MPRSTSQFWEAAEDWSRRKHLILNYYLTPAAPKLRTQSRNGRVFVLDGFAGRGKYEDESPGSPIYMGQLSDQCRSWNSPVDLTIINVEYDIESFRDLESCTKQWVDKGHIINRQGTFQQHLPTVLTEVNSAPLFAFLDAFRPSDLNFDDIVPLLERTHTTEVCIVFHTPAVMRMLEAVRPTARTPEARKAGLAASLDDVFGSRRWEALLSVSAVTPDEIISCLNEEVRSRVRWGSLYICWHGIQARYGVGLKYHIVFLTRHPDGVRLMNDAFVKEQHDVFVNTTPPQTLRLDLSFGEDDTLPVVERTGEERIQSLCDTVVAIGQEAPEKVWRRSGLAFESIIRRFGDFSQAEHRQAIQALLHRQLRPKLIAPNVQPKKTGRIVTNDETEIRFLG